MPYAVLIVACTMLIAACAVLIAARAIRRANRGTHHANCRMHYAPCILLIVARTVLIGNNLPILAGSVGGVATMQHLTKQTPDMMTKH